LASGDVSLLQSGSRRASSQSPVGGIDYLTGATHNPWGGGVHRVEVKGCGRATGDLAAERQNNFLGTIA